MAVGPLARPRNHRCSRVARRLMFDQLSEFLGAQVVPQAVRADQKGVTGRGLHQHAHLRRRFFTRSQRIGQATGRRMQPGTFRAHPALVDHPLRKGMVPAAMQEIPSPEMIDAAIADMAPIDPVWLEQDGREGAMRFALRGQAGQANDRMDLVDQRPQKARSVRFGGNKSVESRLRDQHGVFRSHGAARHPSDPVRENAEDATGRVPALKERDPVLLLGSITLVLGGTDGD